MKEPNFPLNYHPRGSLIKNLALVICDGELSVKYMIHSLAMQNPLSSFQ